jgi:hypothetical protein
MRKELTHVYKSPLCDAPPGIMPARSQLSFCARSRPSPNPAPRATQSSPEQRTARYFDSIRKSPPQQWAFVLRMPKGGDLHNHLSGAIYAESYIQWAADKRAMHQTPGHWLSPAPKPSEKCDPKSEQPPASTALTKSSLYGTNDRWRGRCATGNSRVKAATIISLTRSSNSVPATWNQTGKMLADAVARAARGHVLYLELMLTSGRHYNRGDVQPDRRLSRLGWKPGKHLEQVESRWHRPGHRGGYQEPAGCRSRKGPVIGSAVLLRPIPLLSDRSLHYASVAARRRWARFLRRW